MSDKINPIINTSNITLQENEYIIPANQFTQAGYVYKPYYYVSNEGRIFSGFANIMRERKQQLNEGNYLHLKLRTIDGENADVLSHVLAMKAFREKKPSNPIYPVDNNGNINYDDYYANKVEIDHIDGHHFVPYDNRKDNLQYVTHSTNLYNAYNNGQEEKILSDEDIKNIFRKIRENYPRNIDKELAEEYGVVEFTIRSVRLGKVCYGEKLHMLHEKPVIYKKYKITPEEAVEIMTEINNQYPKNIDKELAEKYGISNHAIRNLRLGRSADIVKFGFKPVRYEDK